MPKLKATPSTACGIDEEALGITGRTASPPARRTTARSSAALVVSTSAKASSASTAPSASASRDANRAARHRPLRGALDVAVEIAVGDVVDAAAGAAHQERAEHEDRQQVPAREAAGGDPQRRQRRPEQQQPAGGAVPADQVEVEREAASCMVDGCAAGQPSSCFWNTSPACSRSAWNLIFGQLLRSRAARVRTPPAPSAHRPRRRPRGARCRR